MVQTAATAEEHCRHELGELLYDLEAVERQMEGPKLQRSRRRKIDRLGRGSTANKKRVHPAPDTMIPRIDPDMHADSNQNDGITDRSLLRETPLADNASAPRKRHSKSPTHKSTKRTKESSQSPTVPSNRKPSDKASSPRSNVLKKLKKERNRLAEEVEKRKARVQAEQRRLDRMKRVKRMEDLQKQKLEAAKRFKTDLQNRLAFAQRRDSLKSDGSKASEPRNITQQRAKGSPREYKKRSPRQNLAARRPPSKPAMKKEVPLVNPQPRHKATMQRLKKNWAILEGSVDQKKKKKRSLGASKSRPASAKSKVELASPHNQGDSETKSCEGSEREYTPRTEGNWNGAELLETTANETNTKVHEQNRVSPLEREVLSQNIKASPAGQENIEHRTIEKPSPAVHQNSEDLTENRLPSHSNVKMTDENIEAKLDSNEATIVSSADYGEGDFEPESPEVVEIVEKGQVEELTMKCPDSRKSDKVEESHKNLDEQIVCDSVKITASSDLPNAEGKEEHESKAKRHENKTKTQGNQRSSTRKKHPPRPHNQESAAEIKKGKQKGKVEYFQENSSNGTSSAGGNAKESGDTHEMMLGAEQLNLEPSNQWRAFQVTLKDELKAKLDVMEQLDLSKLEQNLVALSSSLSNDLMLSEGEKTTSPTLDLTQGRGDADLNEDGFGTCTPTGPSQEESTTRRIPILASPLRNGDDAPSDIRIFSQNLAEELSALNLRISAAYHFQPWTDSQEEEYQALFRPSTAPADSTFDGKNLKEDTIPNESESPAPPVSNVETKNPEKPERKALW